jgi:Family of unknown function (DUF6502)
MGLLLRNCEKRHTFFWHYVMMHESVKASLRAAFRYLLKPLVRLAVKNGVSFPEFSEALKQAYVDVVAKQMRTSGKEPTEEGIFLIANIEIKDVRDILHAGNDTKYGKDAQDWSPLPILLGAWHTDPKFTGPYGVLRDLEFASAVDGPDSFTDLALTYCPGISPQVIFDELIRIGAVQAVGNGFFRAVKRSYVPDPLTVPSILNFARVVHNLCETLEVNLRAERGEGLMERSVYSVHGIPREDYPAFNKFIRARGQVFADDIDNWITARDVEGIKDGMQLGVGFYHYIVNVEDENALSKDLPN